MLGYDNEYFQRLYTDPLKIKKAKFDDVLHLANKYVSEKYQWFYLNLKVQDITSSDSTIDAD